MLTESLSYTTCSLTHFYLSCRYVRLLSLTVLSIRFSCPPFLSPSSSFSLSLSPSSTNHPLITPPNRASKSRQHLHSILNPQSLQRRFRNPNSIPETTRRCTNQDVAHIDLTAHCQGIQSACLLAISFHRPGFSASSLLLGLVSTINQPIYQTILSLFSNY